MKLTGKLIENDLKSFHQKPDLIRGHRTPRILILIADSELAQFYKKTDHHMELIGEAEPDQIHIESGINNKFMGRMVSAAGSTVRHKFEPHMEESRQNNMAFAHDISDFLDKIESKDIFDRLVIIAAPRMLGDLRSHFGKNLQKKIVAEVDKDLTKLESQDLEKALKKIIWF